MTSVVQSQSERGYCTGVSPDPQQSPNVKKKDMAEVMQADLIMHPGNSLAIALHNPVQCLVALYILVTSPHGVNTGNYDLMLTWLSIQCWPYHVIAIQGTIAQSTPQPSWNTSALTTPNR